MSKAKQIDWEHCTPKYLLAHSNIEEPLSNFSWSRVRVCLERYLQLAKEKDLLIFEGKIILDMPWSNCSLTLGPERVEICNRQIPTKIRYTALPPKDIELTVKKILGALRAPGESKCCYLGPDLSSP